jgi:hypothetical protein
MFLLLDSVDAVTNLAQRRPRVSRRDEQPPRL